MARKRGPDIAALVRELPDNLLHCRVTNHWWQSSEARVIRGGFETVEVCAGCGTERVRLLNRRAEVIGSRLRYAEGYLLHGVGRPQGAKDAARLAEIERLVGSAKLRVVG